MRHFIETHFGFVLIAACLLGLVVPGADTAPDALVVVLLAALMFVSSFRFSAGALRGISWRGVSLFYGARFLLLPALLYGLALIIAPAYATGVLLLALLPAGLSCPALSLLFGGNASLAFAYSLPSTVLSTLSIPLMFALLTDAALAPSPAHLFHTLLLTVIVPLLVHLPVRRHARAATLIRSNDKWLSVLLIALTILVVVARQREAILHAPLTLMVPFALALGCYGIFLIAGWLGGRGLARPERITTAVCSGFNNVGLGVSLAFLHFPPPVVLLFVMSEGAWSLLPLAMKMVIRWRGGEVAR